MTTILLLDGYNLLHRARFSYKKGEQHVVFNLLRSLRVLVEKFDPDQVYFVLEGTPKTRIEMDDSYKANRVIDKDDPKYQDLLEFRRQKQIVVDLLKNYFPINTVLHPDYEADDVICNLARYKCGTTDDIVVVSSDSDFYQMLNEFDNVRIWNPVKKRFIETPEYDYVSWKALRGDAADNISGIRGIGDKTAEKLVKNPELLKERLKDPEVCEVFEKNKQMIRFHDMKNEISNLVVCTPKIAWDDVRQELTGYKMFSLTGETAWRKFTNTFRRLTDYHLWEPKW